MAGGASDGAAVMVGHVNGTIKGCCAIIHCYSLCSTSSVTCCVQACETVPCAKRFERLINQIYKFFSHSTARSQKLKDIQKLLNEPELKPQTLGGFHMKCPEKELCGQSSRPLNKRQLKVMQLH